MVIVENSRLEVLCKFSASSPHAENLRRTCGIVIIVENSGEYGGRGENSENSKEYS